MKGTLICSILVSCLLCCHGFKGLHVFLSPQNYVSGTSLMCEHLHEQSPSRGDQRDVSAAWMLRTRVVVWFVCWDGPWGRQAVEELPQMCTCRANGGAASTETAETKPRVGSVEAASHACGMGCGSGLSWEQQKQEEASVTRRQVELGDRWVDGAEFLTVFPWHFFCARVQVLAGMKGQAGGLRELNATCDPEVQRLT